MSNKECPFIAVTFRSVVDLGPGLTQETGDRIRIQPGLFALLRIQVQLSVQDLCPGSNQLFNGTVPRYLGQHAGSVTF